MSANGVDFEAMAKKLIMDIHFCNEESTVKCAGIKYHMECIAQALKETHEAAIRSVEPAKIVLPSEDELLSKYFTWSETKTEMALANCPSDVALWALEYIKRLNAGAAFKIEGE